MYKGNRSHKGWYGKGTRIRKFDRNVWENRTNNLSNVDISTSIGTFSLGRWEKDERIGGAIKRFFSILFFFLFRAEKFRCFAKCDYTGWLVEHDNIISSAIILRNGIWIYSGETAGLTRSSIEIKQGFRVSVDPLLRSCTRLVLHACMRARQWKRISLSLSLYRSPFVYPSRKLAYILIAFHRIPGKIRSKSPRRGSRRDLVVVRRNSDFSRHRTGRNDNLNAPRRFFLAPSDSSSMEDTHVDPINHRFERFSGLNYSSHKLFG